MICPCRSADDGRPVGKLMAVLNDRGHERRMFGIPLNQDRIEAGKAELVIYIEVAISLS